MSPGLLTAVDHRHEADLVQALDGVRDIRVVRRCADVAEVVSVAAAGAADVAIVSVTFRGVDRELIRTLAGHGVRTLGMCERADEAGERTLRQLGVAGVVHPDTQADELADTVRGDSAAERSALARTGGPGVVLDPQSEEGRDLTSAVAPGSGSALAHRDDSDDNDAGAASGGRPLSVAPAQAGSIGAAGDQTRGADRVDDGPEPPPPGRVIAVWGPIGSPGRTTLAVTLAGLLAARARRVLLVDADTWGASIGQVLGLIDESPGVAAAARLSDQGGLDLASLSRLAPEVSAGCRVLTGLPRADRWPELRGSAVTDVLGVARLLADDVIVDCGFALEDDEELSYDTVAPRRNAATLAVLEAADEVLVVGAADPVGLQRLVRGVQDLDALGSVSRTLVVNKVRASASGPAPERAIRDVLGRFSGLDDVTFLPWAPAECDLALWQGRSLVETSPDSALAKAVGRLVDRLIPASASGRGTAARSARGRRHA